MFKSQNYENIFSMYEIFYAIFTVMPEFKYYA